MQAKILKSTDKNYVELDLQMKAETAKACLLSDGIEEAWFPKSQMEDEPEQLDNGLTRVIVPEWLAQDKGFI